jgi:hypothetical protein
MDAVLRRSFHRPRIRPAVAAWGAIPPAVDSARISDSEWEKQKDGMTKRCPWAPADLPDLSVISFFCPPVLEKVSSGERCQEPFSRFSGDFKREACFPGSSGGSARPTRTARRTDCRVAREDRCARVGAVQHVVNQTSISGSLRSSQGDNLPNRPRYAKNGSLHRNKKVGKLRFVIPRQIQ